jgi:hypothetical protein
VFEIITSIETSPIKIESFLAPTNVTDVFKHLHTVDPLKSNNNLEFDENKSDNSCTNSGKTQSSTQCEPRYETSKNSQSSSASFRKQSQSPPSSKSESQIKCNICNKQLNTEAGLKQHLTKKHSAQNI